MDIEITVPLDEALDTPLSNHRSLRDHLIDLAFKAAGDKADFVYEADASLENRDQGLCFVAYVSVPDDDDDERYRRFSRKPTARRLDENRR